MKPIIGFTPGSTLMDIARTDLARKKRRRRILWGGGALPALVAITFLLSRRERAVPSVETATLWTDAVRRGEMITGWNSLKQTRPLPCRTPGAHSPRPLDEKNMNPHLAAALATVLVATEENVSRSFAVAPGGKLVIDVDFGAIEVSTHATSEVSVDVYRKVGLRSVAKEKEFLAERPVTFDQDAGTVTVRSRKAGKINRGWNWGGQKMEGRYIVRVPSRFNVKLDTSGGPIHVSDLTGDVKADTSGGGLKFARIHGPIHADTSGGGIQLADCDGLIQVDTSGGGIGSTGGSGTLRADTSGGSISVKRFAGPAHLDTSGGGIGVRRCVADVVR